MTNKERLEKLMNDMFDSANKQGEGVFDRIEIDIDDFMFLMREAKKANQ